MPLPSNPTYLLRALKGAPLACLFALLLCDQPASQTWLMQATGYSPNSVSAALNLLAEMGLARRNAPHGDWSAHKPLPVELSAALNLDRGAASQPPDLAAQESEPSKFEASQVVIGGGESESDSNSNSEQIPPPPVVAEQIEDLPPTDSSTKRILEATRDLFGEAVHGPPSRYRDRRLLLATIAEVHRARHTYTKPARVVYTRLKLMVSPAPTYLADPCRHLPPTFLAAIGLRTPPSPEPVPDPPAEESDVEPATPPHPSLSRPVGLEGRHTIAQAWQLVMTNLELELPVHVFHQHLSDLYPLQYDPEAAQLTLAAPDEPTRLWLESRMARRLSQKLSGYSTQPVTVKFVVEQTG